MVPNWKNVHLGITLLNFYWIFLSKIIFLKTFLFLKNKSQKNFKTKEKQTNFLWKYIITVYIGTYTKVGLQEINDDHKTLIYWLNDIKTVLFLAGR